MDPLLLGPGEGERITDRPGRFLAVKAGLEQIVVTESRYAEGERGPELRDASSDEERRAVVERFDSYDPPADGGRSPADTLIAAADAGERLTLGDSVAVIKVGAEGANGMLTVLDTTLAPGFPGPVPHRHRQMLDSFWVLEGTLVLRLGERTVEAGPGSCAVAPPGAVHAFSNPGDAPVRMLNVMVPAGLEGYLRETAAAATTDPAEMARIAARYDFEPA